MASSKPPAATSPRRGTGRRRPVDQSRLRERGLFGQAIATGPARLLDEASLINKSGEVGPDGLDGPETEVPLHFAKGRGVPPQETVAHEAENSIPGLSRRGLGHAHSITDICLVCQERRPVAMKMQSGGSAKRPDGAAGLDADLRSAPWAGGPRTTCRFQPWATQVRERPICAGERWDKGPCRQSRSRRARRGAPRVPTGGRRSKPYASPPLWNSAPRRESIFPREVTTCATCGRGAGSFAARSSSDAGRRPALLVWRPALRSLKGNVVDVVARVHPAGSPGVRLFPLPA